MMNDIPLYLRQDIQVEPLVDQWYAWPHLIPPAAYARNVTERHLKIMDSYIGAPQVHANAVKNPKLLGGPFIDYAGKRVDEIQSLRDNTKREKSAIIKLSESLVELDNMVRSNAKGHSMRPLYGRVPDMLRGYVELAYDLSNRPYFRLIEPLLYRSQYYDPSAQTLMLSVTKGDERSFLLSTPRLLDQDSLHLSWSFSDPRIDRLFELKTHPKTWSQIVSGLGLTEKEQVSFQTFLTENGSAPRDRYEGNGVRWRYLGHACVLIETGSVNILLDPVLSYRYESQTPRYTYCDLPESIDYVLITHGHQDHVLFETLLQLRHKIKNIIVPRSGCGELQDPSLKLILENTGFRNVRELGEMETIEIPDGYIMGIPFLGEHSDIMISAKIAHLVRLGRRSLLFAADSCNIEPRLYDHIHREIGDVDALFLGMECDGAPLSWLYGPLLLQRIERAMDESRRLNGSNFEQASLIVNQFGCKSVYIYAMGQEPWLSYIMSLKYTEASQPIIESNRLIQACGELGIYAERLFGKKEVILED